MNSILDLLKSVNTDYPVHYYKKIHDKLDNHEKCFIVTANPEILMLGRSRNDMYNVLKNAEIIPDGIGVVKALNKIGRKSVRNAGIDLVYDVLNYANAKELSVFIYGSKEEVIIDFEKVCSIKWPKINFIGLYNGYSNSKEHIRNSLKSVTCDIILVALGTPSQELFIDSFYQSIQKGICIGIGGSLDVISGHTKRAPKFFLDHNLEWLYRIATEPKRLKRFWNGNILFVYAFYRELIKYKRGKND